MISDDMINSTSQISEALENAWQSTNGALEQAMNNLPQQQQAYQAAAAAAAAASASASGMAAAEVSVAFSVAPAAVVGAGAIAGGIGGAIGYGASQISDGQGGTIASFFGGVLYNMRPSCF